MHALYIKLFIITLLINSSFCFSCQTDDDCNHGQGTCQSDNTCYCKWFYEGESCSVRWQDANHGWISLWTFYNIYTCILQVFLVVLIAWEFKSYRKFRFNMVTIIFLLILLACVGKRTDTRYLLRFFSTLNRLWRRWTQLLWPTNCPCRQCYVLYSRYDLLFLLLLNDDALVHFTNEYFIYFYRIKITQSSNLIDSQHFRYLCHTFCFLLRSLQKSVHFRNCYGSYHDCCIAACDYLGIDFAYSGFGLLSQLLDCHTACYRRSFSLYCRFGFQS